MTFDEETNFWIHVVSARRRHREWRKGQTLMNVLGYFFPELYEMVSGTPADCFYSDENVPAFGEALGITIPDRF